MRPSSHLPVLIAAAAAAWTSAGIAVAQQSGAVPQQGGAVEQKDTAQPLQLTDEQRAKIRNVLQREGSETTFQLSETKPAKDYQPAIGSAVPSALNPLAFPQHLAQDMPVLKQYSYLLMKNQIVVVDAMNRKVIDVFRE